jgi:hypothetical protein
MQILADRDSGDRACSRALDAVLQLTNVEEGRVLFSRHGILPVLIDLLYRSVNTPQALPAPPEASSGAATSTAAVPKASLSPDLQAVIAKSLWSVANLSIDLTNQEQLKSVQAFPLLVRLIEFDMPEEIQARGLQALLNLSVFENVNEDELRTVGLLDKLPALLQRSTDEEVKTLCFKVLRNLCVSNALNARLLLQSNIIRLCLAGLGDSDSLSLRALELVHSLLPSSLAIPQLSAEDARPLFQLLTTDIISDSLAAMCQRTIPLIYPYLDQPAKLVIQQLTAPLPAPE